MFTRSVIRRGMFLFALTFMLGVSSRAAARTEEQTIRAAGEVLQEFLDLQVRQIPDSLLAEAHGVAIIPGVIKLGLVVGGQRGHGVVILRERDGSWRAPLFATITGGSVGWQAGAQSTDFVLVFKTPKSVEGLLRGKFTLGADAAIAAGPVGRRAEAATDTSLQAEIYSYSRSRGLFAGVSLEGSALQVDDAANAAYYSTVGPQGTPVVPPAALQLVDTVARLTNHAPLIAPAAASAPLSMPAGATNVHSHITMVQSELAAASRKLQPLLDDNWRRYLALPAEIYEPGKRPPTAAVAEVLARYGAAARNPQYQTLAMRPEFQATHRWLQSLYEDLNASQQPQLALPPPPISLPR
jgi:lipid-binding SYLF domain-containing protein